jgi:uncharacterized membrane protein YgdD (TMEM256/DUF423 family)
MNAALLLLAALHGAIAVGFGAFAAHALAGTPPQAQDWIRTGALYQLVHAVAILVLALSAPDRRWLEAAGWTLAIGVAIFAGTLYAMAFGAPRWLGAVTPIGGSAIILGWILVGIAALRSGGSPPG